MPHFYHALGTHIVDHHDVCTSSLFFTEPTAGGMYDTATLPVRGMYAESDVCTSCICLPRLSPVVLAVFQVIGLICTAWRIYFRLRIDRFWWEDAWAAAALLSCLASLIGEWIYSLTCKSRSSSQGFDVIVDTAHHQPADALTSSVGFWFYTLGFTSVVR